MESAPVILAEYDEQWPMKFEEEKRFLLEKIGAWNHGGVAHVGSTAVPGLVAKPVIDIMFGVESLPGSRPAIDVLSHSGYNYWPYKADLMHWFCKPSSQFRTHHLHLVPYDSALWHERLQFRDLLRADAALVKEYGALKRKLAARYKNDREAYTEQKWPFISQALRRQTEL